MQRVAPTSLSSTAHAASQRCDYTYINDTMTPEIGRVGKLSYDDEWEAVLAAGWTLKTSGDSLYIFERCR